MQLPGRGTSHLPTKDGAGVQRQEAARPKAPRSAHHQPWFSLLTFALCLLPFFSYRGVIPTCQNRNPSSSVVSSTCRLTGMPWVWPAFVSYLSNTGRSDGSDPVAH